METKFASATDASDVQKHPAKGNLRQKTFHGTATNLNCRKQSSLENFAVAILIKIIMGTEFHGIPISRRNAATMSTLRRKFSVLPSLS